MRRLCTAAAAAAVVVAPGAIAKEHPAPPATSYAVPPRDRVANRVSRSHARPASGERHSQSRLAAVAHPLAGRLVDVTAYCWTGYRTASGAWPAPGMAATLDRGIKFGTHLLIRGLGRFVVTDRIGHGSDVDIYLARRGDCEQRAAAFGRRHLRVIGLDQAGGARG